MIILGMEHHLQVTNIWYFLSNNTPKGGVFIMFTSWKIAKPFGIDLLIHWSFWLLPLWIIFTDRADTAYHLFLVGALFVCVVLHELGHALTARHFGIGTRRIVLTPLGGIAQLDRMSQKPLEEFCIAVAGPAVNVFIALTLGVILAVGYVINGGVDQAGEWYILSVLFHLVALNVVMVLFNMIPAFPMDGGRVFRAILASTVGLLPGTRIAVAVGTVVAAIMGIVGFYFTMNPFLLLIGFFVIFAGRQELNSLEAQARDREFAEDEPLPAMFVSSSWHPGPMRHVTVCVWDPERRRWVRRS
jgi:Zn-dependent protease